jgi:hypothetical protein
MQIGHIPQRNRPGPEFVSESSRQRDGFLSVSVSKGGAKQRGRPGKNIMMRDWA